MKLDSEQQKKVEENMGLVGKVIRDRVHGIDRCVSFDYDDLYQIGCIGLCKAAVTDQGIGCFSTYAYRLIWNEICDALIAGNRRRAREILTGEELPCHCDTIAPGFSTDHLDIQAALESAGSDAPEAIQKGIRVLLMMAYGFSSQEAGDELHVSANSARALASKARAYLRAQPEFLALRGVNV